LGGGDENFPLPSIPSPAYRQAGTKGGKDLLLVVLAIKRAIISEKIARKI
jgi:hypothetical protein